jgi:putative methionine-R-sulfoxide reductase with GAF domain
LIQNKDKNNYDKNSTHSNIQTSNTKLINQQQKTSASITINKDELSSVVFFMSKYFRAYSALGFMYNHKEKVFRLNAYHSRSMSILKNIEIPAGTGIIGNLALEKNTFLSGNLKNYDVNLSYYSTNDTLNSTLAVPILSSTNELLGPLVVDSMDKLAFRDNHKEILNRFSHLAAALINNVRMRIHEKRVADQFQLFYEASQQFSSTQRLNQVLDVLFQILQSNTYYTRIFALQYNLESNLCTITRIVT